MNSIAGILELSLVFGSVLALLVWELVSVRRAQKRDEREQREIDARAKVDSSRRP